MTQHFIAEDGYHYAVDSVRRYQLTWESNGDQVILAEVAGRPSEIRVTGRGVDVILRSGCQAVAAEPGTMYVGLVEAETDGEATTGNSIWFQPVIAWLIQADREPIPVTVHGIEGGVTNKYVIQTSNGAVADWGVGDYENLQEWLATLSFSAEEVEVALRAQQTAMRDRLS